MKLQNYFLFIILMLLTSKALGQVTIGGAEKPNQGALLDLKIQKPDDNNVTSNKGLSIPRVYLSSVNDLFPMFKDDPDYKDTKKEEEDTKHIGLIVYNVNNCLVTNSGTGLWVWDGAEWVPLSQSGGSGSEVSLTPDKTLIEFASGNDAREASSLIQTLNLSWLPTDAIIVANQPTTSGDYSNGITFSNITPAPDGNTQIGSNGSGQITFTAAALSGTEEAPWAMNQSQMTIEVIDAECGGQLFNQEITLKQFNYAIGTYHNGIGNDGAQQSLDGKTSNYIKLDKANEKIIVRVKSNVTWQGTADDEANLFPSITTITGGTDIMTDTDPIATDFTFTTPSGVLRNLKTSTILLEDTKGRANDVTMTFFVCYGSNDPSQGENVISVEPSATSGADVWGDQVVHHKPKPGVYSGFYSAKFGNARWMTTNLAAEKYDSSGEVLTNEINPSNTYDKKYWVYPGVKKEDAKDPALFNEDPFIGYLYTWHAATNAKGGTAGNGNQIQEGGKQIPNVQGICPNGWHLPSDWEWTELENEIMKNTTKYAHVSENIGGSFVHSAAAPGYRGTTHGYAMKDACTGKYEGYSKSIADGGFSLGLAGYASNNGPATFGENGRYWTSSTNNSLFVWARSIMTLKTSGEPTINSGQVQKYITGRINMFSVRCVKD